MPLLSANIDLRGVMRSFRGIVLAAGITGGILFVIHASIPNSNSWPMIWPLLAGGAAFWLATREPEAHRLRTGLAAALVTGVITGVVAFVGLSIAVYVLIHTVATQPIRQSGVSYGLVTAASITGMAALGAVDVVAAFLGGVIMLPVRYFQTRNAPA